MTTNFVLLGIGVGFVSVLALVVVYAKRRFGVSWKKTFELLTRIFD